MSLAAERSTTQFGEGRRQNPRRSQNLQRFSPRSSVPVKRPISKSTSRVMGLASVQGQLDNAVVSGSARYAEPAAVGRLHATGDFVCGELRSILCGKVRTNVPREGQAKALPMLRWRLSHVVPNK